jgi:hypothetical protein
LIKIIPVKTQLNRKPIDLKLFKEKAFTRAAIAESLLKEYFLLAGVKHSHRLYHIRSSAEIDGRHGSLCPRIAQVAFLAFHAKAPAPGASGPLSPMKSALRSMAHPTRSAATWPHP